MSRAHPAHPDPLTDRQLAMLTRLAEIGMEIAEAAGRRAAEGGWADGADPGLSYARAARAVRLTIALQSRLVRERAELDRDETKARTIEAARRRGRIHRRVERALEAERDDGDEVEQLSSAVWECLTEVEDEDLTGRPVDEVVALICRDLGLAARGGPPSVTLRATAPPLSQGSRGPEIASPAERGRSPRSVGEGAGGDPPRARALSAAPPGPAGAAGFPLRPGSSCSASPS